MLCAKICIIDINIYNMQMGFCRKVKKWFDGLDFGFSHLHDYLGLHDYPGLKSMRLFIMFAHTIIIQRLLFLPKKTGTVAYINPGSQYNNNS